MIFHLQSSIQGLLGLTDRKLQALFEMNGKEARKELKERLAKGELYIPSSNCNHFDPRTGCICGYFNTDGTKIQMNKYDIIEPLNGGKRVTHKSFEEGQYIFKNNDNMLEREDGIIEDASPTCDVDKKHPDYLSQTDYCWTIFTPLEYL